MSVYSFDSAVCAVVACENTRCACGAHYSPKAYFESFRFSFCFVSENILYSQISSVCACLSNGIENRIKLVGCDCCPHNHFFFVFHFRGYEKRKTCKQRGEQKKIN